MNSVIRVLRARCLATAALALAAMVCPASAQVSAVQVRDEPLHNLKMETDRYRVYKLLVSPRDAMQFHVHKADNVAVFLSDAEITNEFENGQKTDFLVKTGLASFASASPEKPYVHRILLRGGAPFRNITIEFLKPLSSTPPRDSTEPLDPALVFLRESPRGKAYRLALEPAQSVNLPSNVSDIFVICLTDGSVAQAHRSRPNDGMECVSGAFSLLDRSDTVALRNAGTGRVELTILAVY